jgi:Bacterial PH domain/Short C-terminal domain
MANELRSDISAARDQMSYKLGSGREIKRLIEHLWEGESVERMLSGNYGKGAGLLVLTDRRLLFVKDGVMSKTSEDFPLEKVSSVQWSSGIALGTVTIFASGNKAEIGNVQKRDGKALVDRVRARLATQDAGPAAARESAAEPAAAAGSITDQIRKLGELHDAGILTDDEFATKKAELLGRM